MNATHNFLFDSENHTRILSYTMGVFGRAPAPPNPLWSCCSTNLQLHRGAGSPFGAEEMYLADITTLAPENKNLNRLPSFLHLLFIPVRWCAMHVRVYLHENP
jgi:hypothetical protein